MIKKIILFGSTGMLGNYIYSYFKQYTNIPLFAITVKITEENILNMDSLLIPYNIDKYTCVINCIGQIPQRLINNNNKKYYLINSIFPNILWSICKNNGAKMIQPTTDCVFSGKKKTGLYTELDIHDETNHYGMSKSVGEPNDCTVIRTSIIGKENRNKKSFLEWVINSNNEINGWDNHFWNGITCLEYCKLIEIIINKNLFWSGVRHIFSPTSLSKYEIANIIKETFELKLNIIKTYSTEDSNKTLSSIYPKIYNIPELNIQINELKNFKLLLL